MSNTLEVNKLRKYFSRGRMKKTVIKAVDGIDLTIEKGETLGLVGESGCGKTTAARTILRLTQPTSGRIILDGQDITNLDSRELIKIRRDMQLVFQDPYSSLDPRMKVEDIIAEPLVTHMRLDRSERRRSVLKLLETVGLQDEHARRFPHEFSGGQRQRIAIARAIAVNPKLLILDEPTSSLDVSVQSQILNLLKKIQKSFELTYLFISHNLNVVRYMSNSISVMYLGKIVEEGTTDEVFDSPKHPYTQGLISAIPVVEVDRTRKEVEVSGDVPSPAHPPSGCSFHTRCPFAQPICAEEEPPLIIHGNRLAACHFANSLEHVSGS